MQFRVHRLVEVLDFLFHFLDISVSWQGRHFCREPVCDK